MLQLLRPVRGHGHPPGLGPSVTSRCHCLSATFPPTARHTAADPPPAPSPAPPAPAASLRPTRFAPPLRSATARPPAAASTRPRPWPPPHASPGPKAVH